MSMDWFRHSHGLSTDDKLAFLAQKAGVRRCEMVAFWTCILEHASAHDDRGFVGDINLELISFTQEIEPEKVISMWETVCNVTGVTCNVTLVTDGRIKNFDRYNSVTKKPAMSSAERVRKYREKHKQNQQNELDLKQVDVTACNECNDVTPHNTYLTPKESKNITPLPPSPVDNSEAGVLKMDEGLVVAGVSVFRILDRLDHFELAAAKAAGDGWDITKLAKVYDKGIADRIREIPDKPAKAFTAWIPIYTKGKQP